MEGGAVALLGDDLTPVWQSAAADGRASSLSCAEQPVGINTGLGAAEIDADAAPAKLNISSRASIRDSKRFFMVKAFLSVSCGEDDAALIISLSSKMSTKSACPVAKQRLFVL